MFWNTSDETEQFWVVSWMLQLTVVVEYELTVCSTQLVPRNESRAFHMKSVFQAAGIRLPRAALLFWPMPAESAAQWHISARWMRRSCPFPWFQAPYADGIHCPECMASALQVLVVYSIMFHNQWVHFSIYSWQEAWVKLACPPWEWNLGPLVWQAMNVKNLNDRL